MSMFTDPCTDTYQRCLPKKWAANATHEFKSVQILQPVWLHRLLSFPDTALRPTRKYKYISFTSSSHFIVTIAPIENIITVITSEQVSSVTSLQHIVPCATNQ